MTEGRSIPKRAGAISAIAKAVFIWAVLCLPWGFEPAAVIVFGLLTAIGLPYYRRNEENVP